MHDVLAGLRAVEAASFIAAPSCGLHLAQLGAEVIRIDPIGGGPDYHRWPLTPEGASLYWEGLNKGKKSIAVDFAKAEGRELVQRLAETYQDKTVVFLDKTVCYCSTMNRIDLPHLVWSLEELVAGRVVNQITVDPDTAVRRDPPRP